MRKWRISFCRATKTGDIGFIISWSNCKENTTLNFQRKGLEKLHRITSIRREKEKEKTERMEKSEMEEGVGRGGWEWEPKFRGFISLKATVRRSESEEINGSLKNVRGVGGSMTEEYIQPGWRINDILLAAGILRKVQPSPIFSDEAEMRRVFGLVYDVLRYKKIFDRALKDIGFWRRNSAMKDRERIVWLLLYDMQGRKFARQREMDAVKKRKTIFEAAGLADIENALLEAKTHLAASISRQRIRGSALSLDELLPSRLRVIEGVAWGKEAAIAFGWVNIAKLDNKEQFLEEMSKLGLVCRQDDDTTMELEETSYAFDSICPKLINFHEKARERLAVSSLVRDHRFIFLERSLCIGAATLAKAIRIGRFCGPVILTHCLAPRHTAYLAQLLTEIGHAGKLLAFGTGDRRCEYETYLRKLGVTLQQCRVFSEKYVSHSATAELERATVVLAVPPSSYTGVKDIVDLAVARGGDSDLLESLTNAYTSDDNRNDHRYPQAFLADQMSTLKYALTRPNVQFLIYEVHTILSSETTVMVQRVVDYVNRLATEKYVREHPKKVSKEAKELLKFEKMDESREEDRVSTISANVTVPDSDLFEVGSIDDIYGKNASCLLDSGCFLAVIKRKEMMQFDSLFMINVAESKGLFGDPKERQEAKQQSLPPRSLESNVRKRAKRIKIEIDRIMAHTYSSLSRSKSGNRICPRHLRYNSDWKETIRSTMQVSENVEENSSKSWQHEKANANRLNTLACTEPPQEKGIRALFSTNVDSLTQSDAFTLQNDTLSMLANLIDRKSLIRQEWRQVGSSSTILKAPILTRALQRASFEGDTENRDEENVQVQLETRRVRRSASKRIKKSRLLHPGGSPTNVLDLLSNTV
ncbi:uncharacterized protein LOC114882694 isoform X2 [Osmia bicornis bicornis]|uniref:uncharacterized protein LOC114882694 isoform X2 n=1 Tax=Osmia bicornis bicornis TaxID=1437191 RepID=UPI001EAF1688|nr:uncharacterized protein LOC114882694 isoform X2 [Osmia bicornis bicornis]